MPFIVTKTIANGLEQLDQRLAARQSLSPSLKGLTYATPRFPGASGIGPAPCPGQRPVRAWKESAQAALSSWHEVATER